MYSSLFTTLVIDEQNRRVDELHQKAKLLNSIERRPGMKFSWPRSLFSGFTGKQHTQAAPAEIGKSTKAPC